MIFYSIVAGWFLIGIFISTLVTWLDYYTGTDLKLYHLGYILFAVCLGPIAFIILLSLIILTYWPTINWDITLIKGRKQK